MRVERRKPNARFKMMTGGLPHLNLNFLSVAQVCYLVFVDAADTAAAAAVAVVWVDSGN